LRVPDNFVGNHHFSLQYSPFSAYFAAFSSRIGDWKAASLAGKLPNVESRILYTI